MALSSGMIESATGVRVDDHDELEDVEIIFDAVREVCSLDGGLARCSRLRRLSLINCGVETIGTLAPISATLERLSLCDQCLSSMQGLGWLPQLRWLYLQQNKISQIEGLDKLPKLKTLWLFSNKISSLEGILAECGELSDLWLQDNRITRLSTIQQEESSTKMYGGLSSLQNLELAGNSIAEYCDLCALGNLLRLRSLSMNDEHFGACPVALKKGYREAAVRAVPRLTRLDGHDVKKEEREAADQSYLDAVAEFNARVDDLGLAHRRAIADAESQAQKIGKQSHEEHVVMAQSFRELETLVHDGRTALASAHARQRAAWAAALAELEAALAACLASLTKRQEELQAQNVQRAAHEDAILDALERRARAERQIALIVADLQYATPPFSCKLLCAHTPDFRWLATQLTTSSQQQLSKKEHIPLALISAYRILQEAKAPVARRDDELWFYCAGRDIPEYAKLFRRQSAQPFLTWSSAETALYNALNSTRLEVTKFAESEEFSEDNAIDVLRAAQQSLMQNGSSCDDDTRKDLDPFALKLDDDVGHLALMVLCRRSATSTEKHQAETPEAALYEAQSAHCVVHCRKAQCLALTAADIQPEYLLLVASGLVAEDPHSLEKQLVDMEKEEENDLDQENDPEKFLEKLIEHHTHCASADLDPRAAQVLRDADAYLSQQENDLRRYRSNVQEFRLAQDATLRKSSSSSQVQQQQVDAPSFQKQIRQERRYYGNK